MKVLLLLGSLVICTSTLANAAVPFHALKEVSWEDVRDSVDPKLDLKWLANAAPNGWFMPFLSFGAKFRWGTYLLGEEVIYPDFENFCVVKKWGYPLVSFTGYGQTQAAKCTGDSSLISAWNCTFWSDNSPETKAMVFTSLSDNKDYAVEVRVWDNGETDWVVYSPNKAISEEQKETILKHVESLGLTNANPATVDYAMCKIPSTPSMQRPPVSSIPCGSGGPKRKNGPNSNSYPNPSIATTTVSRKRYQGGSYGGGSSFGGGIVDPPVRSREIASFYIVSNPGYSGNGYSGGSGRRYGSRRSYGWGW